MASKKAEGVVDKNLKVFETNNLYVCDSSVFSTGVEMLIIITMVQL